MKGKKFSLIVCASSMVLCAGALIGTSFAWFTDTASNVDNNIQTGNFDLELQKYDTETAEYINAEEEGVKLFDADKLWGPNDYEIVYLAFTNNGDYDLSYMIDVNVYDFTGEASLSEAFGFGMIYSYGVSEESPVFSSWTAEDDSGFADYGDKYPALQSFTGILPLSEQHYVQGEADNAYTTLKAHDTHYLALGIHMLPSAGNDFINQNFKIDFNMRAKQAVEEATYPITTEEDFLEAYAEAEAGDIITLSPSVVVDQPIQMKSGVTTDGNGATFKTSVVNHSSFDLASGVTDVTIKNVVIEGTDSASDASARPFGIYIHPGVGNVKISNVTFSGSASQLGHSIWADGGNTGSITIDNITTTRPINLSGASTGDNPSSPVSNVTISNSKFNTTFGVSGVTLNGDLHNIKFLNNTYKSGTWDGGYSLACVHTNSLTYEDTDWQNIVFEGNTSNTSTGSKPVIIAKDNNAELNSLINTAISKGRISGSDVEGVTL